MTTENVNLNDSVTEHDTRLDTGDGLKTGMCWKEGSKEFCRLELLLEKQSNNEQGWELMIRV